MPESDISASQPSWQTPPTQAPKKSVAYLIALVTLTVGVVLGYFLSQTFPGVKPTARQIPESGEPEIKLPSNAVQIQACADRNGTLYIKPEDIPVGPVYMVYDGKVIGLKFMLAKDEFLAGKAYDYLPALGVKTKHISVGLNPHGHQGYKVPHYHVDVFTVGREVAEAIVCQPSGAIASPSAEPATHSGTSRFNP